PRALPEDRPASWPSRAKRRRIGNPRSGRAHFRRSGISASDELGRLPPPPAGEGWGGGERVQLTCCLIFLVPLDLVACPHPTPPPQAGEGMHRARGVIV